jgi:hypothetical protein
MLTGMRPALVPVAVLSLSLLAACAPGSGTAGGNAAPSSSSSTPEPSADELVVELDRGEGSEPERYTLTCAGTVAGDLPDAATVCAHLRGLEDPFRPVGADAMCTQQFGGPQTARVTGRWDGKPVDLQLSRTDGCRIAQWDRLGALLPGPVA